MANIRGANTRPEMILRRGLHRLGFRYRLHCPDLPGKPDMVFPKYDAAVFVCGCFWHGHDCDLFRMPSTRRDFWERKITGNRERDIKVSAILGETGWRVLTVWECALKGKMRLGDEKVVRMVADWLCGNEKTGEIRGKKQDACG